jgi:magnesium transporter
MLQPPSCDHLAFPPESAGRVMTCGVPLVSLEIGLITSTLLMAVTLLLYQNLRVGLVLSLSLFIAICSSVITGLIIPYLLGRLKQDPANASGPIATMVQDILTVTIFFLIASWVLG